jgi:hypothetical protein
MNKTIGFVIDDDILCVGCSVARYETTVNSCKPILSEHVEWEDTYEIDFINKRMLRIGSKYEVFCKKCKTTIDNNSSVTQWLMNKLKINIGETK